MTETLLLILIPLAYVLGSVPFGLIVGLAKGIDPRTAGSGNIGATNVGRLLGGKFFGIVFTLDMLKSFVPMMVCSFIVRRAPQEPDWHIYFLWLLVGFAAVIGHMFSIFLKFKGGKGVATSAGLILGLYPHYTIPALCSIGTWLLIFKIWQIVSLASIVGTMTFPLFYVLFALWWRQPLFTDHLPLLVFAVVTASLIVFRHRSNIRRLREGTEPRFGKREKEREKEEAGNGSTKP
jgi:glycerol-3-phosphate acyltransferase PlsY